MKDKIILCHTLKEATQVFEDFIKYYKPYIEKITIRKIKLKNGRFISFDGLTEGLERFIGYRSDIIWIDDFKWEEDFCELKEECNGRANNT